MNKITYYGSEKDISEAIAFLKNQGGDLKSMREGEARLVIQKLIDEHYLRASILVNGNSVWSKDRILRNLERIMKHGTLYNAENQKKPPHLSRYFYNFLHLNCGSIAHYDIHGWIHKYPTVEHLKKFFKCNEFGKRVLDWIPKWHTDTRAIVTEIERQLFPFETYMRTRNLNSQKSPKRQ